MSGFSSPTAAYAALSAAAAMQTITPGLDTALLFWTVTAEGSRRGFLVGLGACCGVLIWGGVVAVGLGALLTASQPGYTVMRSIGAAYLCYLGIGMLVRPRHAFDTAMVCVT